MPDHGNRRDRPEDRFEELPGVGPDAGNHTRRGDDLAGGICHGLLIAAEIVMPSARAHSPHFSVTACVVKRRNHRSWNFIAVSYESHEHLFDENSPPRDQSDDLAARAVRILGNSVALIR